MVPEVLIAVWAMPIFVACTATWEPDDNLA